MACEPGYFPAAKSAKVLIDTLARARHLVRMASLVDPLKFHRELVGDAERRLEQARTNARAAAERMKLPLGGLFAEGTFVFRTSAEQWVIRAERVGVDRGRQEMLGLITALANPATSPYAHLASVDFSVLNDRSARSSKAAPQSSKTTAQQILEAAETARRGGPERPKPTGTAARILRAGEARRRPMGDD